MKYCFGSSRSNSTLLLAAIAAAQQQSQPPADPEFQQIEKTIREAWQEAERYVRAGGKESDPNYPGRKWAATLWQYRQQHLHAPGARSWPAEKDMI
jgi:hypothetical protein